MRFARILFLLCLLTFLCTSGRAQCPADPDVTLSSQTDVDIHALSFPNRTTPGNLTVNGSDTDNLSNPNTVSRFSFDIAATPETVDLRWRTTAEEDNEQNPDLIYKAPASYYVHCG